MILDACFEIPKLQDSIFGSVCDAILIVWSLSPLGFGIQISFVCSFYFMEFGILGTFEQYVVCLNTPGYNFNFVCTGGMLPHYWKIDPSVD